MNRYAIISDIHGNSRALESVLNDIRSRGITEVINLGDFFFGALEPEVTAGLLREFPMQCITGNTDREILEAVDNPSAKRRPGMDRVIADLSAESIEWLRSLPGTSKLDDLFFICHGTPTSDNEYLLEKVTDKGVFVYNDEDLMVKTENISQQIILCGHSHVNRTVWLSNGKIILNPGSVGLPAYLGTGEYRFAMESNTPHAKYAIVSADADRINIEQVLVTYDWGAASAAALTNGNPDAARFLLHGRMPKDLRVQ